MVALTLPRSAFRWIIMKLETIETDISIRDYTGLVGYSDTAYSDKLLIVTLLAFP